MKKMLLLSSVIITSIAIANDPQKKDASFYNQCVKPNVEALKKKFDENRPMLEAHAKTAHKHYTEFSKTTEYSLAKTCIGFGLLSDAVINRAYRSRLRYIAQVAAGLYFSTPVIKQVYTDIAKRK